MNRPSYFDLIKLPPEREAPPISGPPQSGSGPRRVTLADALADFWRQAQHGLPPLLSTGMSGLDETMGGGIDLGEMVVMGGLPGHGKSAIGLQCVHYWTEQGLPCAYLSEEMTRRALAKRALQWITPVKESRWKDMAEHVEMDVRAYRDRAPCWVIEECRHVSIASEEIRQLVGRHGVKCVVVDYAQLLQGEGRTRYEEISNVSLTLRRLATELKIVLLVLCHLTRDIEKRGGAFKPRLSDIKESGQFAQDADVITFLCWPWKLDDDAPKEKFHFFVEKNRNRDCKKFVECKFDAARQMFLDWTPEVADVFF
jgi:replicative DNA helicase